MVQNYVANVDLMGDPLFGNVELGALLGKISLGFFPSPREK
jgi:hypothetical protein